MLLVSLSSPLLPLVWYVSSTWHTDTAIVIIYCRVVTRSLSITVNISLCPASSFSDLSAGLYSIQVYDIESDGSVSPVQAIIVSMMISVGIRGTVCNLH